MYDDGYSSVESPCCVVGLGTCDDERGDTRPWGDPG